MIYEKFYILKTPFGDSIEPVGCFNIANFNILYTTAQFVYFKWKFNM